MLLVKGTGCMGVQLLRIATALLDSLKASGFGDPRSIFTIELDNKTGISNL